MKCDYSDEFILALLTKQLSFFSITQEETKYLHAAYLEAKKRTEYCFSASTNKYYKKDGETVFNPFHSGQWCIFLYYLSNTIYTTKILTPLCDKIYYLNRMLNAVDLFYEVNLPPIFELDHPLGTVIGRGTFGNYFFFSQGCTVGNNKGFFPVFGENVKMMSNSKVIGNTFIGDNVIIAANTFIKDQNVDSNLIVFGTSPNLIFKTNKNK